MNRFKQIDGQIFLLKRKREMRRSRFFSYDDKSYFIEYVINFGEGANKLPFLFQFSPFLVHFAARSAKFANQMRVKKWQ